MKNLKNISKQVLSLIAIFALTTLSLNNLDAHTTDIDFPSNQITLEFAESSDFAETASPFAPTNPNFYNPQAMGIKIKIVIIIIIKKKKKKGVVEVVGTRIAEQGRKTQLKANEILAEVSRNGNNFIIMPLKGVYANSEYGFPPSFKVSKEVSAKLGIRVPFGLKATRIIMGINKRGVSAMKDLEAEDRVK